MKLLMVIIMSLLLICAWGCIHVREYKPLPDEAESAIRTNEDDSTNLDLPGLEPTETQADADLELNF